MFFVSVCQYNLFMCVHVCACMYACRDGEGMHQGECHSLAGLAAAALRRQRMASGGIVPGWSMTALALGSVTCQIFLGASWGLATASIWRPELLSQTAVPTCNYNPPPESIALRQEAQRCPPSCLCRRNWLEWQALCPRLV